MALTDSEIYDTITDSWLRDADITVTRAEQSSDFIMIDVSDVNGDGAGIFLDREDLDRLIVLLNTRRAEMGPAKA